MRITIANELNGIGNGRLWVVQRWTDRSGWFDYSICTTLPEAEEDYITALEQDGHDRNTRIVRVEIKTVKECAAAR
jgi:hypothetical protein